MTTDVFLDYFVSEGVRVPSDTEEYRDGKRISREVVSEASIANHAEDSAFSQP